MLATLSIVAYNCHFIDFFEDSPVGYMFHIMYFRSHHCESAIDWTVLGVENIAVKPEMPTETMLVTRTFYIAVIQVIFSSLLIITSLIMMSEYFIFVLPKYFLFICVLQAC